MKLSNANENMWLQGLNRNLKLTQDAESQDADRMQAKSVLHMIQFDAIPQQ